MIERNALLLTRLLHRRPQRSIGCHAACNGKLRCTIHVNGVHRMTHQCINYRLLKRCCNIGFIHRAAFHLNTIHIIQYRRLQATETKVKRTICHLSHRKGNGMWFAFLGLLFNLRSTRIAKSDGAGHLIKCFTGCIVPRPAQNLINTIIFYIHQMGMSPRYHQTQERWFQRCIFYIISTNMSMNVVNTNRPMAGTPARLIRRMEDMQRKARWKVSGFVNNTNMSYETTVADLESGYSIVKQASEQTGIPVLYTTGKKEVLDAFLQTGHDMKYVGTPYYVETYMHRDWDTLTKKGV